MVEPSTASASRSSFVTGIGWLFIILSSLWALVNLSQCLVHLMTDQDPFTTPGGPFHAAVLPPLLEFMIQHRSAISLVELAVSVFAIVSAIGLLRRRNWARLTFIAVLVIGIAWCVVGLFLQDPATAGMESFMQAMPSQTVPPEAVGFMQAMLSVVSFIGYATNAVFIALLGWLIERLLSQRYQPEFTR
jgi:hypothetical protein